MPIHVTTLLAVLVTAALSARSLAVSAKTKKLMSLISPLIATIAGQVSDIQTRVPLLSSGTPVDLTEDVANLQTVSDALGKLQASLPVAPLAPSTAPSAPAVDVPSTAPVVTDPVTGNVVSGG